MTEAVSDSARQTESTPNLTPEGQRLADALVKDSPEIKAFRAAALDAIQSLRHAAACNFTPEYSGAVGEARCKTFYEAYEAVRTLPVPPTAALLLTAPEGEGAGLREALEDMLAGWRYVRERHGDMSGVGWERAEQKAVAALTQQPAAQEPAAAGVVDWQPIETAPRDETHILVARTESKPIRAWFQGHRWWMHGCGPFDGRPADLTGAYAPTHWLPLPAAPGATLTPAAPKTPDAATGGSVEDGGLREAWAPDCEYRTTEGCCAHRGCHCAEIARLRAFAQPAPVGNPATLRTAIAGIADDYMTSEKHHPGYVLIPTAKFEELRTLGSSSVGEDETGVREADTPGDRTDDLVDRFAVALKAKLRLSEDTRGWKDGQPSAWRCADWQERCQTALAHHVWKGDPIDVAAFAAFCWHHGWPTYASRIHGARKTASVVPTPAGEAAYQARHPGAPLGDCEDWAVDAWNRVAEAAVRSANNDGLQKAFRDGAVWADKFPAHAEFSSRRAKAAAHYVSGPTTTPFKVEAPTRAGVGEPLTAVALADALECFWNAALGAQRTETSPVGCMAEGFQAIAIRLRENAALSTAPAARPGDEVEALKNLAKGIVADHERWGTRASLAKQAEGALAANGIVFRDGRFVPAAAPAADGGRA